MKSKSKSPHTTRELSRPDRAVIYQSRYLSSIWYWRLTDSKLNVLCSSSEDFDTMRKARNNLERVTGGKFLGMKDDENREEGEPLYRGILQRS